ncbi:SDR family NAD(P)-dependent oxidoreductase [Alteromonas aestuariivivens]|uniref:SDR family NAD(P)-dependent oxidoreductase n=1 Tax=Alteromonas aestuariivivens TaxID=1938339 RepID=A0A3D8M2T8_9ALTE|nr:SDR family NAD(P)-dependent oxidoreductase [Alteromonas aestuariivivens]RDV23999.1 SDR family NAD(P)-dependent oxidoreductase [Alteromonas aestuariivivens]
MAKVIVIIGASGGIGRALVNACMRRYPQSRIHALSRSGFREPGWNEQVECYPVDTGDEPSIAAWVTQNLGSADTVSIAVCTVGVLHDAPDWGPEKKLEDVNTTQMEHYFRVNTLVPALWMKHLLGYMEPQRSVLACLSARVGSISDNRLGGWYGYRASKAALNMMIKTAAVEYRRRSENTVLLAYHPGTVDTGLSQPFQSRVPADKLFSTDFTAECLLTIIERLTPEQSPAYLDWQGQPIDW